MPHPDVRVALLLGGAARPRAAALARRLGRGIGATAEGGARARAPGGGRRSLDGCDEGVLACGGGGGAVRLLPLLESE